MEANTTQSQCCYEAVVHINQCVSLFSLMEDMGWFGTIKGLRFIGIFSGFSVEWEWS